MTNSTAQEVFTNNSSGNTFNQTALFKEIDLIQACIERMARNSFMLKGWMVTLLSILFIWNSSQAQSVILACAVMLIIILAFWYLDSFYLWTETKYRALYSWVIKARTNGDRSHMFNLDTTDTAYFTADKQIKTRCDIYRSKTLMAFYGSSAIVSLILMLAVKLTA